MQRRIGAPIVLSTLKVVIDSAAARDYVCVAITTAGPLSRNRPCLRTPTAALTASTCSTSFSASPLTLAPFAIAAAERRVRAKSPAARFTSRAAAGTRATTTARRQRQPPPHRPPIATDRAPKEAVARAWTIRWPQLRAPNSNAPRWRIASRLSLPRRPLRGATSPDSARNPRRGRRQVLFLDRPLIDAALIGRRKEALDPLEHLFGGLRAQDPVAQ